MIPSLPGYGFSGKPTAPGWNPVSIAKAWATLMQRLGYTRYVAQGGDWGNAVSEIMALQQPPGLLGIHTNMAGHRSAPICPRRSPPAARRRPVSRADEKHAWDQLDYFYKKGLGYAIEMNNRPQTLYGIVGFAGRPRGLDARPRHSQLGDDRPRLRRQDRGADARRHPRQRHALLADEHRDLLGAPLLGHRAQSAGGRLLRARGIKIPVAVSAFPEEIYAAPQSWAERAYPKLIHYNKAPQGRPFRGLGAAGTVRARRCATAFKSLRQAT